MTKPFNISTINNQKEALAIYLEVNSDINSEFEKIENNGVYGPLGSQVHCFRYKTQLYLVSGSSNGLSGEKCINFNNSLWTVKYIDPQSPSPYERFFDKFVMQALARVLPTKYRIIAINQSEHRVLCREDNGFLVVFSYTSHIPEEL